jgi:hypothetical protein
MRIVALDTTLMILLYVGTYSRAKIEEHKRLGSYASKDFDELLAVVAEYDVLLSTSASLSQVSDLLNFSHKRPHNRKLASVFCALVALIEEKFIATVEACNRDEFASFGLADTAWFLALEEDVAFYSADQALVNYALALGKQAKWFKPSRL